MNKGTVKWFDRRKGYGFIIAEDGSEVFVHFSSIVMEGFKVLHEKDAVTFDTDTDENGRTVAVNVKKQ